jgi:FkbM family methyltransferase
MDERDLILLRSLADRLAHVESVVAEIRSLVGPFGTLFPDGTMLVQTIHGLKYFIDPSDEVMAPQLVVYRQWEPELSRFIRNSMTSDTVFVDVGANFGYFTCLAASRIGRDGRGRVISIEPNPAMERLLQKNCRINWSLASIEIHECAIAEHTGSVQLLVPRGRAANASVVRGSGDASDERLSVRARSLDDLLGGAAVDLIKVDVEGFETAVLRGAHNTLGNCSAIQVVLEWSLDQMETAGFRADDLLEVFAEQRLEAYHLPPSRFIDSTEWSKFKIVTEALRTTKYENILLRRGP